MVPPNTPLFTVLTFLNRLIIMMLSFALRAADVYARYFFLSCLLLLLLLLFCHCHCRYLHPHAQDAHTHRLFKLSRPLALRGCCGQQPQQLVVTGPGPSLAWHCRLPTCTDALGPPVGLPAAAPPSPGPWSGSDPEADDRPGGVSPKSAASEASATAAPRTLCCTVPCQPAPAEAAGNEGDGQPGPHGTLHRQRERVWRMQDRRSCQPPRQRPTASEHEISELLRLLLLLLLGAAMEITHLLRLLILLLLGVGTGICPGCVSPWTSPLAQVLESSSWMQTERNAAERRRSWLRGRRAGGMMAPKQPSQPDPEPGLLFWSC